MYRRWFVTIVLAIFILTIMGTIFLEQNPIQAQGIEIPPLLSVLQILPPVGEEPGHAGEPWGFDWTLVDYLTVTICQVTAENDCVFVEELTSQSADRGLDYIKVQTRQYHVNWYAAQDNKGTAFQISIDVAGLEVGSYSYTLDRNGALPIKFRIDNHPRIRARVLHEQDYTAAEVAEILKSEFDLPALETAEILADEKYTVFEIGEALRDVFGLDSRTIAQILKDIGFSAVLVGTLLRDVFGLDASITALILKLIGFSVVEVGFVLHEVFAMEALSTAQILKDIGYSASNVYKVLKLVFGLNLAAARQILEEVGFSDEEIFEIVIEELAIKFAPQLRFDSGCWTCPGPDSYPMSAQVYFDIKSQNPSQYLSNGDAASITNNKIPLYWKAFQCGRQIRLVYWIFYGYQYDCDCFSGEHDADWEHILVVLSEDTTQIAAVTYYQHSGQYTRIGGRAGFEVAEGTHPVVNVGRANHGSYHNRQTAFQTCCYWEDHRDADGPWMNSWLGPIIRMQSAAAGGETWMDADIAETFTWGEISQHPMNNSSGDCGEMTCVGTPTWGCGTSGCFRSQCEVGDRDDGITCWHCPSGYIDWGTFCVEDCSWYPFCPSTGISTYGLRYTISTSDAGLLYKVPWSDFLGSNNSKTLTLAEYEQLIEVFAKMFSVTLGMSVEEIEAANANGLNLCQIAESRDIDLGKVWTSTQDNREALLQQSLDEGLVTWTQAEWISERLSGFEPYDVCGGNTIFLPLITNE